MLQIGEDVDHLLIPREIRLAGAVWRVISKPATKEAEFRERLTQFLEEEGRTLEDVARLIEKSTPHPPQPPKRPKEPGGRRRVPQMATPPPRLVVGTYDSSNASDSDFSDFEACRAQAARGARRGRRVRRMPVSYLGSKFLGSDVESEDDEELVEAFLRRGEKQPSAPPARRRVAVPVPVVEDNPGLPLSRAERWREYVGRVSWGRLKQRVKGWAPRASPRLGEARRASTEGVEPERAGGGRGCGEAGIAGGAPRPRRWRPKITWASFRTRRRAGAGVLAAQRAGAAENQRAEALDNQRAEAVADQGALDNQRPEAAADQGVAALDNQRAEARADQGAGALDNQRAEAAADQGAGALDNQRAEAVADQGAGALDNQRAEAAADQGAGALDNQRAEAIADQGAGALDNQRAEASADPGEEGADNRRAEASANPRAGAVGSQRAEASAIQEAETPPALRATGSVPGARARKPVKTVRFQTPGRFSWFRKRWRAFWNSPRLPALPKRSPRAGEARSLRVLRAGARAEGGRGEREQEAQL
ncbi:coiled-coil domain-containing protein 8 [Lepus europaeus]|uniref:coiled-coil domain-containing protein 8 n=1 Tax=Lepus europaeus TaxID=9983 RepID=UPI002B4A6823|nr:coiled-coil domain-containing protein 8 [Lepus europaeus]